MVTIKTLLRVVCILVFLQLLAVGVAVSAATPINYGDYVKGTISTKSTWNTYTFTGTVGDPIYLRLKTDWAYYGQIRLFDPHGIEIASPWGTSGAETKKVLLTGGQYTILVGDREGDNTGNYDLYLQRTNKSVGAIPLSFGDYYHGTIAQRALFATHTFSGNKGDKVYLRLKTGWAYYGQIRLFAPNGTEIASPWGTSGAETLTVLPNDGQYTILVGDREGDNTGDYDLYLQRTNNPRNAITIHKEDTLFGTITHRAMYDTYNFYGCKGNTVYLRLKTGWAYYGQIRLFAPNGTEIASPWGTSGAETTTVLPNDGQYTILVGDREGDNTGTYNLFMQLFGTCSSLTVTSPNGGEAWQRGSIHTISWTSSGDVGPNVKIEVLKAGVVVQTLSSSTPNDGSFGWTISPGLVNGPDYRIRITSTTTPSITDSSNSNFALTSGITVTSPNGGEAWQRGSIHPITWTSSGDVGSNVKIEVLKSGILVQTLSSSTPNDGSFSWTISPGLVNGPDYRIRINSTTAAFTDSSNSNFAITAVTPGIVITSPNGGETWQRGTPHTITWDFTGNPGLFVKITRLQGGVEVGTISLSTSIGTGGHGSFLWNINPAGSYGSDCRVKIQSISQPTIFDTSNNYFTLKPVPNTDGLTAGSMIMD